LLTRRQFAFSAAFQASPRPNVLFIVCEGWRRQAMPGADKDLVAPHLARLAVEGVEFTRAYASNPAIGPSQAALHTGRYPHSVGMPWNGRLLPADYPCLSQAFADAGYQTGLIGKWHLDGDATPSGPRRRGFQYWAAIEDGWKPALEFIGKSKPGPFLLFVSFGSYQPPERYAKRYKPEELSLRENVPAPLETDARKLLAAYYGLCSSVDDHVGRLLKALDEQGAAENTIVVFTGDHGDMLHSHGLEGKGSWYEESAGVPMLMRWPGKLAAGSKQDWLFNNIDLAPTLRGLCGLPPIEGAQGEDRSTLIRNKGAGERPESIYVQGELGTPQEWRTVVRGWDKFVVDRELKATHLYNLAQDPFEKDDLAVDRGTIRRQEELAALIRRWIVKSGDRVPYPGRAPVEENKG
jgi:arylsulfatase A-like enzyme